MKPMAPTPPDLIAGVLLTIFALPIVAALAAYKYQRREIVPMSRHDNHPGRGQTVKHISQMNDNKDKKDETVAPTVEQKLEAALSEISKLNGDITKLKEHIGDFIPDGHVMLPLEKYQILQEVLREHNAVMPAFIINEAIELRLLDKENLKGYSPEQIKAIDEYLTLPDDTLLGYFDNWVKRNPEYGFQFVFVKTEKAKAS